MTEAWSYLGQDGLMLSSTERQRVHRAFYRVELFFHVFRYIQPGMDHFPTEDSVLFARRHYPWENEQLACVHDFLEKKFSGGTHVISSSIVYPSSAQNSLATRDVLAHDIGLGHAQVDYLANGSENYWKQHWVSFST